MYITINGTEYPMATTLRVAYCVQGQHNHKPYSEVFQNIGNMSIEDQIGILYCSFSCANPDKSKTMDRLTFQNALLDSPDMTLSKIMKLITELIKSIMGDDLPKDTEDVSEDTEDVATPRQIAG